MPNPSNFSSLGIYCHIPFCKSICPFCDFAVLGDRKELHRGYVDSLLREIFFRRKSLENPPKVSSMYFGGGTPSRLPLGLLEEILSCLEKSFGFASGVEIAFEVNPEDAQEAYLHGLKKLGVNRLSLGLQSMDKKTLLALGRKHTPQQNEQAFSLAKKVGFTNINADLLFGVPWVKREEEVFLSSLEKVLAWGPQHLSLYGLDLQPNTPFGRDRKLQTWAKKEQQELQEKSYLLAVELVEKKGFVHYEVSNFCQPGFLGQQNLLVWGGKHYLGFGLGAHSFWEGERLWNTKKAAAYKSLLEKGKLPVEGKETIGPEEKALEELFLALRQKGGWEYRKWGEKHHLAWGEKQQKLVEKLVTEGKVVEEPSRIKLSSTGFLLADSIASALWSMQEK